MISFGAENVDLPQLDYKKLEKWLYQVADLYNKRIGNLNYLFCNDEEILRVNRNFLKHDYFTDIITFDYSYNDKISGDIYISIDTVKSNSELFKVSNEKELLRVIVHGMLHLCGIDDKGPGEREIMEKHENKALELYDI